MKITRRFTKANIDVFSTVKWAKRTSRISNSDGSVVFEMKDAEVPESWSQLATDIMVSKYFRKAGVPQGGAGDGGTGVSPVGQKAEDRTGETPVPPTADQKTGGTPVPPATGPEKSARQVIHRLAGCWRHWGETHGYFDTAEDAQAFYDELCHMMLHQMAAPNSPQWFNTGLNWAYGITGPAQGHFIVDPATGEVKLADDAYTHPQPHACVAGDTMVLTSEGWLKVQEVVERNRTDLRVFDGQCWTSIVATKRNGTRRLHRMMLANGQYADVTDDHLILASNKRGRDGGVYEWTAAGECLGRKVLLAVNEDQMSEEATARRQRLALHTAELAGFHVGDGYAGTYAGITHFGVCTATSEEFERVASLFEQQFGAFTVTAKPEVSPEYRIVRHDFTETIEFREAFDLGLGSANVRVPDRVFRASAEAQRAFLRGLFQADGAVRIRRGNGRNSGDVVLATISERLAHDVQTLLSGLGIYARRIECRDSRPDRATLHHVIIAYASERAKFEEQIGFVDSAKSARLRKLNRHVKGKRKPAVSEETVVSWRDLGEAEVYDIQTGTGRFAANGIVVHNCFIQSVSDDLVNSGGIMDLWVREARLFKYGSGTGTNFSSLRGEGEPLSGGGTSSGLMSWLKIGDRAAAAIKSGGTTRRAAKMVCLDLDHPDIEAFVNWKVREELKVAAMVEGLKTLPKDQQQIAADLGLKLDYDFNGEAYYTVSGQNSNNSVRIPDAFFDALDKGEPWNLYQRTTGDLHHSIESKRLWDEICYAAWRCADPGVQFDSTINAWHTCPNSGRINASNPCVTGDTLVATETGYRRIADLVGRSATIINGDGQRVYVDRIFKTGTKPVFELKTAGGYSLRLTADHKVKTFNRGDVPACELTLDDVLILQGPGFGDEFVPEAFGEVLGAALGDGCIVRGEREDALFITLGSAEAEVASHLQGCIAECKQWLSTGDGRGQRRTKVVQTSTGLRVGTAVSLVIETLSQYAVLDARSAGKRFTEQVFALDRRSLAAVLRGLFTTDGTVANYGTKSQYVALDSTSRELLRQVQLLLLGFGIKSKVYENRRVLGQETAMLPDGAGGMREYPVQQMHSLRISRASRVRFEKEIGFIAASAKSRRLADLNRKVGTYREPLLDRVASLTACGVEDVYDLTEPRSHHFVANGLVVHNCSEYMFLDNTACNLASINLLEFYDAKNAAFDIEGYEHAIRLWTIVLEISVLMAAFPSEEIARLSYDFRTLGLGFANIGAMLMQAGIAYDSDEARALCGCLTAILTGRSYAVSAEMAGQLGPFPGFAKNREPMLRVIRNHRRAAHGIARGSGQYESLRIAPVPIDHDATRRAGDRFASAGNLLGRAMRAWDEALDLGEKHGYRNAQVTVIAPTGTIGLLMDCDTTGVEPDFALVKFKKLAGGGYFKIANNSLRPALETLGYREQQVRDIIRYVMGSLSLNVLMPGSEGGTFKEFLGRKGFTEDDLDAVEAQLGSVFEIGFAFSAWSIREDLLRQLGVDVEKARGNSSFSLLREIGLSAAQIESLNETICGTQTVEGAPHLKDEHLPVFDCANPCGKKGTRFIAPQGHIRMMAASQPFISGAISKTINLPKDATVDDIAACYRLSWELGLKANALYRDGCKLSQPLSTKSDAAVEALQDGEEDEMDLEAAKKEVAHDVTAVAAIAAAPDGDSVRTVEKIVERIVERPLRRRLADTRRSLTHKFNVAGHEGYLTVGLYDDGMPGELFLTMSKEGSTIGGLMDSLGTAISVALQYGVPLESLVGKFTHQRFEPAGMTTNADIPFAKSLVDYIFRWMGIQFISGYRSQAAPQRGGDDIAPAPRPLAEVVVREAPPSPAHGPRHAEPARNGEETRLGAVVDREHTSITMTETRTRSRTVLDRAMGELMGDAPVCDVCGALTVRNGTCYKCMNCGNSMGCS